MPTTAANENEGATPEEPIVEIQKTLGILFMPTGAIALFCNVLGISGQNTACISLAAVTLTAICIYRRKINQAVPSAYLLSLLIALAATFSPNYEKILFKDTGLLHYFHASNDFLGEAGPFLGKANKEIWFVGMDFHITAGGRKDLILSKLRQGVKVRFLVFDNNSPLLNSIAQDFDQDPREIRSECVKSTQSLISLRDEWKQDAAYNRYPDGLEVRFFQDVPHARFYLVDPDDPHAQSFYVPYMNHANSPSLPGYLMRNIDSGVIQQYLPGIRKLWATSEPVDQFLTLHPQAS